MVTLFLAKLVCILHSAGTLFLGRAKLFEKLMHALKANPISPQSVEGGYALPKVLWNRSGLTHQANLLSTK